jgi:hypothetical protein
MQRSTIIASVVAGAGILIAGSVAGTAAVNAAASSEPDPSNIQLVAAPADLTQPVAAVADSDAVTLPPFTTEPLPSIVAPSGSLTSSVPSTSSVPAPGPGADAASAPEQTRAAKPGAQTPTQTPTPALPPEQAVALVLAATGNGRPLDVRQVSRAGYSAWAVTVQRSDGSIVTGFVDRVTATVFDWQVMQEAPKPAPTTTGYPEGEYEDEEENEEYENDEYENEEYEDEEHEGDEDDD